MRTLRRFLFLGVSSALVVSGFPSAGAQTPTVVSVIGSAEGVNVALEIETLINNDEVAAQELFELDFGPTPTVTLPPTGGSNSQVVVGLDESAGPISFTAESLVVETEGALGPDGFAFAQATVTGVALVEEIINGIVAQQLAEPILAAELIDATCESDLTGVAGSATLLDVEVLGTALEEQPAPNTQLTVGPIVDIGEVGVTLNRQVENPDGSLSVTALVLEVNVGTEVLEVTGTVEISQATCGVVEGLEVAPEPLVPVPAEPLAVTPRFTG